MFPVMYGILCHSPINHCDELMKNNWPACHLVDKAHSNHLTGLHKYSRRHFFIGKSSTQWVGPEPWRKIFSLTNSRPKEVHTIQCVANKMLACNRYLPGQLPMVVAVCFN